MVSRRMALEGCHRPLGETPCASRGCNDPMESMGPTSDDKAMGPGPGPVLAADLNKNSSWGDVDPIILKNVLWSMSGKTREPNNESHK
jgi:hypothetical protein